MSRFLITGQKRLSGTFTPVGNKNAALPMLAACLLTDETVVLHNVPDIQDVRVMLELLAALGVSVESKSGTVSLRAAGIRRTRLDRELCRRVRASILLAGPLTVRTGRATVYPPGGDFIGRRRIDTHMAGLRALGIKVEGGDFYTFRAKSLRGADILLDEAKLGGILVELQGEENRSLAVMGIGINLLGDAVRDRLDPRMRGSR